MAARFRAGKLPNFQPQPNMDSPFRPSLVGQAYSRPKLAGMVPEQPGRKHFGRIFGTQKGQRVYLENFWPQSRSQVLIFEPFEHLGWDAQEMLGWHGFHGWRFIPHNSGTLIITQEIQKGVGDFLVAPVVKKTLEKGHQMWLENLVRE